MNELEDILIERGGNYGDFVEMSDLAQTLKMIMKRSRGWDNLGSYKKESLDMICTKIARILTGNSDLVDSWKDVSGYSELVVIEIIKKER